MDRFTGIHAVREALEAGAAFDRILIAKGRQDTRIEEIVQLARQRSIPVRSKIAASSIASPIPATIKG
jgi:tRNA G18 (ribose-2'-O)-methylase SpoU